MKCSHCGQPVTELVLQVYPWPPPAPSLNKPRFRRWCGPCFVGHGAPDETATPQAKSKVETAKR